MGQDRDVTAFDRRAGAYDRGWLGRWHAQVATRVADVVLAADAAPRRVLDVGCGTGLLLADLAGRLPAAELVGVDAAPGMAKQAAEKAAGRWAVQVAFAEHLPFRAAAFDLVVSTTSFDHWADQAAGLAECARVLRPGGRLVLADLFAPWLAVTTLRRRDRVRTPRRLDGLLTADFAGPGWHKIAFPVRAVVADRKPVG